MPLMAKTLKGDSIHNTTQVPLKRDSIHDTDTSKTEGDDKATKTGHHSRHDTKVNDEEKKKEDTEAGNCKHELWNYDIETIT